MADLAKIVESLQKRLQVLEDEKAIQQLINTYCYTADHHEWKAFSETFVEDGIMGFEGWGPVQGRQKIEQTAGGAEDRFQGLQHTITNLAIKLNGDDEATGTSYLFFVATPDVDKPEINYSFGGWYRWEFVKTAQGWKIKTMNLKRTWSMGTDTEKQWT